MSSRSGTITPPGLTRTTGLFAFVLASLLLAACRTTVEVDVAQDDSGGGTVTAAVELDREALEAAGGAEVLRLDDLEGTSWRVDEGAGATDGGWRVEATRPFTDAADLQAALDELAGPGTFTDVTSEVSRSFAMTEHDLSMEVAVTGELAQFSDEALTETLGGLPVGYTPDELALLGADQPGAATMVVTVSVPGGEPDRVEFDLASGDPQEGVLSSSSEERDSSVYVLAALGALAVVAGLALGSFAIVRRRRSARGR